MGSQDKPTTRRYTVEQKDQAVRLVRKDRAEFPCRAALLI
jgi:hypothetical protein